VSKVPEGVKFTSDNAAEMGAKGGKAKAGSKHISTHIQEMLNDENFELKMKDGSILRGRPMDAIIKTAIAKGVSGDMRAFDMLGKYGYGNKLDVTTNGKDLPTPIITLEGDGVHRDSGNQEG
jgi:hypothetical protein